MSDEEIRKIAYEFPPAIYYYASDIDKNPCIAYYYALDVDKNPRENTRNSACQDSRYAYLYAKDVDKRPH